MKTQRDPTAHHDVQLHGAYCAPSSALVVVTQRLVIRYATHSIPLVLSLPQTWKIDEEVKIRSTESGIGALAPRTVIQAFKDTVAKHPNAPVLHVKREGEWCVPSSNFVIS